MSIQDEGAVVTIEHAQDGALSGPILQMAWHEFSQYVRDEGVPIPAIIRATASDNAGKSPHRLKVLQLQLPKASPDVNASAGKALIPLTGHEKKNEPGEIPKETKLYKAGAEVRDLNVVYDRSQVLLSDMELNDSAKELLAKYKTAWGVREPFEKLNLSHWWWVPRWTIPIWKAAGHEHFYPPEAAVAVEAIVTVRQQPDLLYSDGFVVGVLQQQATETPALVKSACEALGGVGSFRSLITDWIKNGYRLSHVQYLLEDLANKGSQDSEVTPVDCDIDRIWRRGADHPSTISLFRQVNHAITEGFKPEPPIRVYIDDTLVEHIAPSGRLGKEVQGRIDELRSRIKRDLGFSVPGVRFRSEPELNPDHFRIEVRNQLNTPPFRASAGQEVDDIMRALEERFIRTRPAWLDIEEVTQLINDLPPDLRDWLSNSKKYTPAKLKRLLREVLHQGGSKYSDIEAKEVYEPLRPGATLAHFSWLIRSLAFWGQVCPPDDYACLGIGLRYTQNARMAQRVEEHSINRPLATSPGIDSLENRRFDEAEGHFRQWLSRSDRRLVIDTFVQAYAKAVAQIAYKDV
jgi:hypothetical protein